MSGGSSVMRVLHVRTVRGTGGGPDKTVLKSCQFLAAGGHVADAFYIFDRRNMTGRLPAMAGQLGVRLLVAVEDTPFSLATVARLSRTLRRGRYDLVHTHEYKSNTLVQLLRAEHNYTVVATAHGYNRTTRREAVYYAIERLMLRHVEAIITPTRELAGYLRTFGIPPGRLHVIHNAIETSAQERPPRHERSSCVRLLYLGRLSREKDPANLLRAMSILVQSGADVHLTLAGDGPERPALQELLVHLRLGNHVQMPGFVTDVMGLLGNADILVNPSRTECMPNSVLEAMWAGVPVAATDVGGLGEMIRHGIDGLLCPPRDPPALARTLGRLIADEALGGRLTGNAYQRVVSEFSFERRMQRILDLYRQLLDRGKAAGMGR